MTAEYTEGFYGMSLPKPAALWLMLVSPAKGLLTLSPFLVLLLRLGTPTSPERRARAGIAGATIVAYLLFIASIPSYHGGFSFGARLLIPVLPFVLILLAESLETLPARLWPLFWIGTLAGATVLRYRHRDADRGALRLHQPAGTATASVALPRPDRSPRGTAPGTPLDLRPPAPARHHRGDRRLEPLPAYFDSTPGGGVMGVPPGLFLSCSFHPRIRAWAPSASASSIIPFFW